MTVILPYLLALAGTVASACEKEPPFVSNVEECPGGQFCPPDPGPTTNVWTVELGRKAGFGDGLPPLFIDDPDEATGRGGLLAVLHALDSITYLYHLNPETGAKLDSIRVDASVLGSKGFEIGGNYHHRGDTLIVGTSARGTIDSYIALDLRTGKILWTEPRGGTLNLFDDDTGNFIGTAKDEHLRQYEAYRLNASTGKLDLLFTRPYADSIWNAGWNGPSFFRTPSGNPAVLLTEGYVANKSNKTYYHLFALDLSTGRDMWRREYITRGFGFSGPMLPRYRGDFLVQTWDTLRRIDPLTGRDRWATHVGLDFVGSNDTSVANVNWAGAPLVIDSIRGFVYQVGANHWLQAFDLETGERMWEVRHNTISSLFAPLVDFRDERDHRGWRFPYPHQRYGGGAKYMVYGATDGILHLIHADDGTDVGVVNPATDQGRLNDGFTYDARRRRFYLWDGYRASCQELPESF